MNLLSILIAPRARRKPSGAPPKSDPSVWSVRDAAARGGARLLGLVLLVLLLFVGLVMGGAVHQVLHHDDDGGGDFLTGQLIGFEPPVESTPLIFRTTETAAATTRIDEPRSRLRRSGARPRAPPPAA